MAYDPTLRKEFEKDGYSQEEKYFYELNRELIERLRENSGNSGQMPSVPTEEPANSSQTSFFSQLKSKLKKKLFAREGSPDLF